MLRVLTAVALALCLFGCGPRDFTECSRQAAKDSRSDMALRVLMRACFEQFPQNGKQPAADNDMALGALFAAIPVFFVGFFVGRRSRRPVA